MKTARPRLRCLPSALRWGALCGLMLAGCDEHGSPPAPPAGEPAQVDAALARLVAEENEARARTDFAAQPLAEDVLGADPVRVQTLPGSGRFLGLLRGSSELSLLDAGGAVLHRLPAPVSPTGLAVAGDGAIFVTGELADHVARYRAEGDTLRRDGVLRLVGPSGPARAVRDVAYGPEGVLYVVEEYDDRLLIVDLSTAAFAPDAPQRDPLPAIVEVDACQGPFQVARVASSLVVNCLLDHALLVREVDERGHPRADRETRIEHDGPIWSFAALADGDRLLLALGGVEDHPLDRTQGYFGNVDSYLYLYGVVPGTPVGAPLVALNLSERGAVTPKALDLRREGATLELVVSGYGSDRLLRVGWGDLAEPPQVHAREAPAGVSSLARIDGDRYLLASPLLDRFFVAGPAGWQAAPPLASPGQSPGGVRIRVGEALFHTTLMAPSGTSEGSHSRFTCETCHLEGHVDGRTHHSGRGDVRVTTRSLRGLFNDKPYFSRALDPNLTTMVHSEFRVASAGTPQDPWFTIDLAASPWLRLLVGAGDQPPDKLGPEELRRAMVSFFAAFTHRPNPEAVTREVFQPVEQTGAEVFRARCAGCHAPRLVADDPGTEVPFERWASHIFSRQGPIVWATSSYHKTGLLPYVHEQGARTPSLRRLYKKRPYFVDGSSATLHDVLARARWHGEAFFHGGDVPEAAEALPADDQAAVVAFLRLL